MPNEIKSLENGRISAKLETGEIFEGDAIEVTTKLAEAKTSTRRYADEWKSKYETLEAQRAAPPVVQATPDANEKQLQEYLLNQTAKALGYDNGEQYKAELTRVKGAVSQVSQSSALQQFFTVHPEYPATPEANDLIGKIFEEKGWTDMTADNLHFAHLEALDRHRRDPKQGYEPLTAEAQNAAWANQMQAANRQPPPPMLRGNNPEQLTSGVNPYSMPLNDLRKQAIEQELSRK